MVRVPKKPGRPSSFTQEIGIELCARIMGSDYGLEQVCEADDMPSHQTVYRWLSSDDKAFDPFREQYARAKLAQGHVQADRATRDALNANDAGLGRLKFDARKWQAAKLAAKVYGDSVQLKHADSEGDKLAPSDTAVAARLAAILEEARKRRDEG